MAQYLPLPDGTSVTIRAGESPQDAWLRAQRMYPEAFSAKPAAKPETTFGGNVREFFKGLAPGAVGLVESAAVGASSLLPQDMEESARKRIAEIAGAAKAPFAAAPGYEEAVGRKLGEAGGSTIPFLALGPAGIAGRVGMAALGTGAGAGEARTRAEQDSATADQRGTATALGAVVGVSEMFAPLRILGRLSDPVKAGAAAQIKRIAAAGGEEAAQEAAAQIAQNLIAKGIYKPEQAIIEQVGESAAYGGAVGAMAQGLLDLALGRRASKAGTADEIAQARAEADAARAAEEARKADPAYAPQFVADYEARKAALLQQRAELKKPGKGDTPDIWQAYKDRKKELDALNATLEDDAKEYNALRKQIAPALEQEQIQAELTRLREQAQGQTVLPGFETETVTPPVESTAEPAFVDYNQQVRLLRDRLDELRIQAQQTPALDAKIELGRLYSQTQTALQQAEQLLAQQKAAAPTSPDAKINRLRKEMAAAETEGDIAKQAKLALKLQELGVTDLAAPISAPAQAEIPMQPFKTKVSTKAEYSAVDYKPGAADIESQEQAYLEEVERQRQEAMREAEREQKLAPEVLALRRIQAAERPALAEGVQRQGQISGLVDQLGEALRGGKAPVAGRVVSGGVETDLSEIEELRAQLAFAKATNNRQREQELRKQLEDLRTPDEVLSVDDLDFGERSRLAGVEGRLTPEAMAANRVTRMSQTQLRAYDKLAAFVQSVRESDPQMKRTAGEERALADAAERLKDVVAGQALLEVNSRRAQAKQEALSIEKQTELVGRVNNLLDELVFRGAPLFNKTETPAVTRGTLTLRSAETRRPPRGRQVFPNFTAAASSLRAQMRSIMDSVGGIKAPAAAAPKAPGKARIVTEGLRREPEGRERSIEKQFEAAFDRAKTDEDYRTLKELQRRMKNMSPELQAEVLEQVRRVATGRALDLSPQLQQSLETSRRAGESDMEQEELFAGTSERGTFRTTPEKFQKYLGSAEVQKKIAALQTQQARAKKQADKVTAQSQALQVKIAQTDKILSNIEKAKPKTEIGKAAQNLKAALTRGQPAVEAADRVQEVRRRALRDITETIDEIKAEVKASEKDLDQLGKDYAFITQQLAIGPRYQSTREAVRRVESQIGATETALADAKKALDEADTAYKQLLEKHATDTIENSIIRKGEAERQKIEKALKSLQDAEQAASDARIKLLESKRAAPSVGAVDIVRVYRDTADSKVQADVAKERKNIGKAEEAHAAATTAAERAAAIKDIETSYNKVYELLNNAPLKQERMSDTSAAAQKKFDEAQAAELDQTLKLFEETAGIAPLKMRARRTIAFVRDAATGRVQTQVKKESVAQQERRFKQEQETGEYAASKIEELAKANADLRDVQRQINYIDANRAEPRTPARKRQDEARTNAVAKRKELEAQIKALKVAQKETVAEARTERQAEKELRKEAGRMLRRGQEGLFSRGTPAQGGQTISELEQSLDRALGEKGLARRRINLFESVATFLANSKYKYEYSSADVPTDAKAFVDPKTGDVFMFANNIAKNESVGVLLHEVGVHIGFRKLFGAARYNALVQTVRNWASRKDGSLESKIAQRALARVEAAETSAEQVDDELLAYAVEEAVKAGVEPSAFKKGSPLQNWLQIVLDTLRKALSAFGIDANKLTSGDLVNMAYGAAQMEVRGTWHGSDAKFTAFDTKKARQGEGAFDRRFDLENSIGEGPYTTPQQDYAEYYQYAVPFGKAANNTGYGGMSYQDYRALDEKLQAPNVDLLPTELKQKFESRLLTAYLQGVSNGESLNPASNPSAKNLVEKLTAAARNVAEKQAVATLDLDKLKGLTERPAMGHLYAALDDMPRSQIFEINSMQTVGDRPKVDALLRKYGDQFAVAQAEEDGKYPGNSLFYRMQRELGTKETVRLFKDAGIRALERNVEGGKKTERAYIEQAPDVIPLPEKPIGPAKGLLFSRAPAYASPEMEEAVGKLDPFVTKQRGVNERVRAASGGFLGLETRLVDRFAGFERLRKYMPELQGTQMIYYMRMYDQRMNMVSQAVGTGAPVIAEKKREDGKIERVLEAKEGPSIKGVVETLKDASPMVGNGEAVNRLFTAYMAGIRADNKGFESLNFGEGVTRADLDSALSVVNGNPELKAIFDKARGEYNEYNRNLINFVVETGALSKRTATRLLAENDYIPFYRERNGMAELLIGNEAPIRIGSIKSQPYLQELVGGDQPILDFMTSSVQNTNMLIDMGMRNLATKNAVFELLDLSAAKLVRKAEGPDVVQFKVDGEDRYAVLATEKVKIGNKEFDTGVPADILVKGMEGIPTQMPFIFRALAIPAQLLRKGVTLSPMYMANQLFRDSLAAPIAAGANFTPVLGALRQIGKPAGETLERRGITGGQQFTGGADDMAMILRGIADGKPGWMNLLAKAEAFAMSADSLTRRAQYNSYIEQGMSEMEATLLALESMNFNKRGASPSIHIANALIPFFNAQIQGLNVLYKAMTGQMIFNDKLKIRQKLLQRGGMMAAASIVYAIMMQDDEAYKNAEADQKYGKWFVRIPGVDEPIRVPIPFEIGYIFKALPEALVNSMLDDHGGEQAVKAFKQIVLQTIPGGSSYGIPQAMKPAIEAGLGKSFYTGRDILSAREKELLPEEQFRNNTAEMSKLIGQVTGTSPIVFENLVRGYTGTVGLAFLHALSVGVPPGESPEKAVKRLSEYPIVGGAFQPNDAGGITNSMYERMNDAQKVERTYEKLVEEGRMAEAKALLQRRGNEFLQAELAKEFKSNMNQLVAAERAIQASDLSPEEKRKQLDQIRKLKIAVAKEIRDVADKTVQLSFSL